MPSSTSSTRLCAAVSQPPTGNQATRKRAVWLLPDSSGSPSGPGRRAGLSALARVAERPREGVVGDLLPPVLGGQQVRPAGVLLDLGDRVRLVVAGVRALDTRRHQVVLPTGD